MREGSWRLAGLLTVLSFAVGPLSGAHAALDPELAKPYRLQVVLDVTEHRLLTRVFLDQLLRDLRDLLQANLGDLAKVEVIDLAKETRKKNRAKEARKVPPLFKAVQSDGLEKGLDGFREVSDVKTHFIRLRFVNGQYQLQARQHDGATGMPSPLVRTDQTTDPGLVARKAAKLVDRDFGLVGTVMKVADGTVELAIKGGKLGVDLDRWVKVNEVFAIAHMTPALRPAPVGLAPGDGQAERGRVQLQVLPPPENGHPVGRGRRVRVPLPQAGDHPGASALAAARLQDERTIWRVAGPRQ
jgi:hypothetical protein